MWSLEPMDLTPEEADELDAFMAKPSPIQGREFKGLPLADEAEG